MPGLVPNLKFKMQQMVVSEIVSKKGTKTKEVFNKCSARIFQKINNQIAATI